MTGHISKESRKTALLLIAIVFLVEGWHPPSSAPGDTAAVSHEVSQALVGKQITIRGKFASLTKGDPYVLLDNQQEVWIGPRRSEEEDLYSKMDGKLVEATGTLRFHHNPTPVHEIRAIQLQPDHFYFEAGTTQLRLISP